VADRPLDASWPCVRTPWAGIDDGYPGVRDQYLATGDVVAERVRAGQMTQAEARLAMQRARSEARAATTSPRAVVCLPFNGMIVCRQAIRAASTRPNRTPMNVSTLISEKVESGLASV